MPIRAEDVQVDRRPYASAWHPVLSLVPGRLNALESRLPLDMGAVDFVSGNCHSERELPSCLQT